MTLVGIIGPLNSESEALPQGRHVPFVAIGSAASVFVDNHRTPWPTSNRTIFPWNFLNHIPINVKATHLGQGFFLNFDEHFLGVRDSTSYSVIF